MIFPVMLVSLLYAQAEVDSGGLSTKAGARDASQGLAAHETKLAEYSEG